MRKFEGKKLLLLLLLFYCGKVENDSVENILEILACSLLAKCVTTKHKTKQKDQRCGHRNVSAGKSASQITDPYKRWGLGGETLQIVF